MIATRPVISGFHPDPSICRVGDTYYLVTSSFEYSPGVPIFRSTDLVQWEQIGNVLDRPEHLERVGVRASGGIYAPTLRYHDEMFWMICTNVTNGPGQLIVTARDPAGPWSAPTHVPEAHGIDPDLCWDESGRCWLTWSGADAIGHGILQAQLDPASGELLTEVDVIWRGTGGQYPEGPHLYKHAEHWYLVIAEGGTERGHAVTVARAEKPNGPFQASPTNPFLTARGTDSSTQNTGHADFVEGEDGGWAVVFLGARPRGSTPGWHTMGRETFAAHLSWESGWPAIGAPIEPPKGGVVMEHLAAEKLPLSFVSPVGLPADLLYFDDGRWRLRGGSGVFVGRRQEQRYCQVRAIMPDGGALEIRIDDRNSVRAEITSASICAVATIGGIVIPLGEMPGNAGSTIELRTEPSRAPEGTPEHGPDEIVVLASEGETRIELGRIDGRYFSTEVAGGFTGRMIGLSSPSADVVVEYFGYCGSDSYDELAAADACRPVAG
ncbi:glycoside hydrolase family 43 protein [Microbacterium sp. NPDC089698]|uniref:glycoside hydrolase family 43 protein n=1 Tax=Microbacterium sp. NPDC089698 TaxID=3364200 RepID=UPI003825EC44